MIRRLLLPAYRLLLSSPFFLIWTLTACLTPPHPSAAEFTYALHSCEHGETLSRAAVSWTRKK
jgi:hypothetical protein